MPGLRNSLWVVGQGSPRDSTDTTDYCCCSWISPPRSGVSLYGWRYTWHTELRLQLYLTCEPPPWGLVLRAAEGARQTARGGKQWILPHSFKVWSIGPAWQDVSKSTIVALVSWQESKTVQSDLQQAQQERNHAWFWNPRQLCRAFEFINLRGEPTTASLLAQHNSLLHSRT